MCYPLKIKSIIIIIIIIMVEMAIFIIQRAITLKVGKQELQFMCSACRHMVFNICVKFHEFKVMERT